METTPNTVNELLDSQEGVNENTNDDSVETVTKEEKKYNKKLRKIMKTIMSESPEVGLDVVKIVLRKLEGLHSDVLSEKFEEGNVNDSVMWSKDLSTLRHVIRMLDDVVLWHSDNLNTLITTQWWVCYTIEVHYWWVTWTSIQQSIPLRPLVVSWS